MCESVITDGVAYGDCIKQVALKERSGILHLCVNYFKILCLMAYSVSAVFVPSSNFRLMLAM